MTGTPTGDAVEVHATVVDPTAEAVAGAIALISNDDEWADVDDGDLTPSDGPTAIPMLTLNRKLDGGFVLPDTGELASQLDIILLAKQDTRAWFPDAFGTKDAAKVPACWSSDSITPDERSTQIMSPTCATCPLSQWEDGDPPKCKQSIVTMAFVPDPGGAGRFVRIRWGGIAFAPIRQYWASFRNRIPKRPPMAYVTHVTLEATDTNNGKFLKPVFVRGADIARRELAPVIAERDLRLVEFKELTAGDAQTRDTADNGDDPFPTAAAMRDGAGEVVYSETEAPF